ncbi:hypothetical protein F5148DRAFT_153009 [Russula earlei]|uniref:Uncharacterized protein n=1 Tax=Russula earlei TaxID=71964 RepID=A0ACC0TR17_9AGAM|nr:hypothetical protein F5148DRAFT_153009 [Russula earlei]
MRRWTTRAHPFNIKTAQRSRVSRHGPLPASPPIRSSSAWRHMDTPNRVTPSNAYNASQQIHPYVPFNNTQQPPGDKWNPTTGVFDFWGLIDAGFLNADGTPANGIDYDFDTCSQTPFVYNSKTDVMVSYDDATSFAAKGNYIKTAGLLGFAMWEAGGDSNDILLDAIRSAL